MFLRRFQFWPWVAGGLAGFCNGLFGGGGGMLLVPLLINQCHLTSRQAFATSVAIILPLCALSAGLYGLRGGLSLTAALPYMIGGLLGGLLSSRLLQKANPNFLRKGFALLLLYGGLRSLFLW